MERVRDLIKNEGYEIGNIDATIIAQAPKMRPFIDEMIEKYESTEHPENKVPKILIAPSWQPDNIIDSCIDGLLEALAKTDYDIIVRPHPQQVRHQPEKFEIMKEK